MSWSKALYMEQVDIIASGSGHSQEAVELIFNNIGALDCLDIIGIANVKFETNKNYSKEKLIAAFDELVLDELEYNMSNSSEVEDILLNDIDSVCNIADEKDL